MFLLYNALDFSGYIKINRSTIQQIQVITINEPKSPEVNKITRINNQSGRKFIVLFFLFLICYPGWKTFMLGQISPVWSNIQNNGRAIGLHSFFYMMQTSGKPTFQKNSMTILFQPYKTNVKHKVLHNCFV